MNTDILEPQPDDPTHPGAIAGWLDRLHATATALLPEQFTIRVMWNDDTTNEPLTLTFHRSSPDWDLGEVQYRVTEPVTVPHLDGTGATTLPADTIRFTGRWLNRHYFRRPLAADSDLSRDFGNRIVDGIHRDPAADQSILLAELIRVVRLRQRVGETDTRNGGHDTDITRIQHQLSATLT